jgi:hypothetical protein
MAARRVAATPASTPMTASRGTTMVRAWAVVWILVRMGVFVAVHAGHVARPPWAAAEHKWRWAHGTASMMVVRSAAAFEAASTRAAVASATLLIGSFEGVGEAASTVPWTSAKTFSILRFVGVVVQGRGIDLWRVFGGGLVVSVLARA